MCLIPVPNSALDLRAAEPAARAVHQDQRISKGLPAATIILNRAQKRTRLTTEAAAALGELSLTADASRGRHSPTTTAADWP